jgi:hypothetical protein
VILIIFGLEAAFVLKFYNPASAEYLGGVLSSLELIIGELGLSSRLVVTIQT